MSRRGVSWRLGWMLPAGLGLLAGLDAALLLLGLPAPVTTARLPQVHGMLLVLGFVGTLIALERATALRRWYGFAAPGLLGAGGIALITTPLPLVIGQSLLVAGAAALTAVYLPLWRRQHDDAVLTQLLAAFLAVPGAILWLAGAGMDRVLPWLIGFLVLTIAAERVELARLTLGPRAGARMLVHAASVGLALLVGLWHADLGAVMLGAALLALVAWLLRHDVARRTIRSTGAPRYMAGAILAGYVWLSVAGALLLVGAPEGARYDAVVHAVLLGYTMSMIMAHATSILPAVLRIALPYRSAFWVPVGLLHLSLVVRLWLGDALGWQAAWRIGGVLGVVALLVFVGTAVTSAVLGPPRPAAPAGTADGQDRPGRRRVTERRGLLAGAAMAATLAVLAAALLVPSHDPAPLAEGRDAQAQDAQGEEASGAGSEAAPVEVVQVTAANMRFDPAVIDVPAGAHLVIELHNTDDAMTHDLVLADGSRTPRLAPGESARLDAGVVGAGQEAWCSVAGHRQMGMVLTLRVQDAEGPAGEGTTAAPEPSAPAAAPYDAALEPLPPQDGPVTREVTFTVTEQEHEIAPGLRRELWTFDGTAPGPVLHGRVGDTFEITLVNDGTMGHSMDFHAGQYAPDEPMRTLAPGESLTFSFTATRAGIWMYHCGTAPVSAHIASGMYGAVIIEDPALPAVDRSFVLVQGEYYDQEVPSGEPEHVVLNGYADQYVHAPLEAAPGERVRFWVLDAGPQRPSSFHVIGGQFDTVWSEGRYLLDRAEGTGSQAMALQPGQGGFVELVLTEPGHYPFLTHHLIDAERGATGMLEIAG